MVSSEKGVNLSSISSNTYYQFSGVPSFTIPSLPISSTSHKRKRSEDLGIVTHIAINNQEIDSQAIDEHTKRCQQHKIHSELHQNTIDLMMNSQKILQEQERMHKLYDGEVSMHEDINMHETKDSFKQRPFWPVINKVHA